MDLTGQHALVTGGGRGIGRCIALRLATHGARVSALSRRAAPLAEVERAAALTSGGVAAVVADITDDAALAAALRAATAVRGPVAILVNCAGYAPPHTPVVRASVGDWDRTLDTCLRAPMVLSRLVLPDMLERRRGCIVNIASVAARRAAAGEAGYAAAKSGLLAFTRALFAEVRDAGIKVSALCPGLVDTAFVPTNKRVDRGAFLQPDDVADAVLQILAAPPRCCPVEIDIEPQHDPFKQSPAGRRETS